MSDAARSQPYTPADRLSLWLLTRPEQPVLIGELNLVRTTQGASLRYAETWLERGFPLSEVLFNILIDNTDDHEKNHALIMQDSQQYELSPAYDVLPSGQALGFQQMRVGEQEADSTLLNALCDATSDD
jgi:hypothetical protein